MCITSVSGPNQPGFRDRRVRETGMKQIITSTCILLLICAVLSGQETAPASSPKTVWIRVADEGRYMVDTSLATHIKTKLERARNADIVIFEIDTYGGQVLAASEIRETIMDFVSSHDARVIAYIEKKAVSAGAMITVSCPEIVMLPEAHFGDCAPVVSGADGPKMLNENDKITSVLRKEFETACRKYGYPYRLGHAMVSQSFASYVLMESSKIKMYSLDEFGKLPELEREKISGSDIPSRTEVFFPQNVRKILGDVKKDEEKIQYPDLEDVKEPVIVVTDEVFEVDGKRMCFFSQSPDARMDFQGLTEPEEAFFKLRFLHQIDSEKKMLELSGEEAYKYHFSKKLVNNRTELFDYLGVSESEVQELEPSKAENVIRWLNQPMIMGLFIMIGMIALYAEFHTPGFGLAGIIGIIAFGLYFLISFLTVQPNLLPVLLFLVGMVLLFLEIFVIPGFGIAGISGIILLIGGLMTVRMPAGFFSADKSSEWRVEHFTEPVIVVFGGIVAGFIGCIIAARFLPELSIFSKHVVTGPDRLESASEGGISVSSVKVDISPGDEGVVSAQLRPSGKIEIGDHTLAAVSNGDFIEKGSRIRVVKVKGNQIIVEKA